MLKIRNILQEKTVIQRGLQWLGLFFSLVFIMGCTRPTLSENAQGDTQAIVETIGTLTIGPISSQPTPTHDLILESAPYPEPTPTPRPHPGIYPAPAQEITLHTDVVDVQSLYIAGFDNGRILAGSTGHKFILLLNLETSEIQKITGSSGRGMGDPKISGQRIIWSEKAPELGQDEVYLKVVDLTTHQEKTLRSGFMRYRAFQDDIIVWQAPGNKKWNIYGYNLANNQEFVVVEKSGTSTFPQVCSNEWGIYLQYEGRSPGKANLYAYNLNRGQHQFIGEVIFPNDARVGERHACDNNWVAWVDATLVVGTVQSWNAYTGEYRTASTLLHKQHLYDLETNTETTLEENVSSSKVKLVENILLEDRYDIEQDIYFNLFPHDLPQEYAIGSGPWFSNDIVIWLNQPYNGTKRLLTTHLIRD